MKKMLLSPALVLLCLAFAPAAALAEEGTEDTSLVVSLPPGGCTLMLFPDGSGNIIYGAAPQTVRVTARTFDFANMLQSLRSKAQRKVGPWDDTPVASVVFADSSEALRVHDTAMVRNLLETGWKSRLPPDERWNASEAAHAWIKRACAFE